MEEIFLAGDPRFLSGGLPSATAINYSYPLPRIFEGTRVVDNGYLREFHLNPDDSSPLHNHLSLAGQAVHKGKRGYHNRPELNVFVPEGENPTVGVELETEERLDVSLDELESHLRSNWFHFESDSSLRDDRHEGYELITEPLPPSKYRDIRLWTGLQNVLVPWVTSYDSPYTGLHVHVGLDQFMAMDGLGFTTGVDRRTLGRYLSAAVYMCLADRAFTDSVFLRRNTMYCSNNIQPNLANITSTIAASGGIKGSAFLAEVVNMVMLADVQTWRERLNAIASDLDDSNRGIGSSGLKFRASRDKFLTDPRGFGDHSVEVNCSHPYTVEFRRGKGTLNGVSIHRMVEFCTLVVKYAGHIVENPSEIVSKGTFIDYVIANTNSAALRSFAEKQKGN